MESMKKTIKYITIGIFALITLLVCMPKNLSAQEDSKKIFCTLTEIQEEEQEGSESIKQSYKCRENKDKDEKIIEFSRIKSSDTKDNYEVGDKVVLSVFEDQSGNKIYSISSHDRRISLIFLFAFFIIVAIAVAKKTAIFSIISLALTFSVVLFLIMPQINAGRNPILVVGLGSLLLIPLTFYLSHGFKKQTTIAVVSSLISLVFIGILSVIFTQTTHLQGLSSEEALFLTQDETYNLKGLLLAGIIVASLGVLDDITIAQTSVVYQLKEVSPNLSVQELFKQSMTLGKNHIASMINTLFLVYAGSSLPLLIMITKQEANISEILNHEMIATEIVQTLVGSIGLTLAVPITAFMASYIAGKSESSK